MVDFAAMLEAHSIPEPNSGCWLWLRSTNTSGYGAFRIGGGKKILAHRAAWIAANGEIPEGICILHRCDTPLCVNPNHLFAGTNTDNVADRVMKGRTSCGQRHPRAKLTEGDVIRIFALHKDGATNQSIADSMGVVQSAVSEILTGRAWTHLKLEHV